jgi:membrane protein implicated in regulation of membrane protease activity
MEINQEVIVWVIIGVVLIASEIFTGTFHLLFFGMAGLLTAAVVYLGAPALWIQVVLFSIMSLLSFYFVKSKFSDRRKSSSFEADINQSLVMSEDLKARSEGTILYQGAPWTAVNTSDIDLVRGQKAVITKTEGVKIFLRPQS